MLKMGRKGSTMYIRVSSCFYE